MKLMLEHDVDAEVDTLAVPRAGLSGGGSPKRPVKKRRERKGHLLCPGCDQLKPIEEFDLAHRVDRECRRYLDRISHQCRTQGKQAWFKEMRSTDKGTKSMLDFYRKVLAACNTDKGVRFSVAQYQEQSRTEQAIEFSGRGRMMWERQAVEWWMSTSGGGLSQDDAQARWDMWAANFKSMEIIHDYLSPNVSKPLRLRVPMADDVDFVNRAVDAKMVTNSEAIVKKPGDDKIEQMKSRIMTGFEKQGNASANAGRMQTAQSMVSAGAGEAFSDVGVVLPDITVLGLEQQLREAGEEQAAGPGSAMVLAANSGGASGSGSSSGGSGGALAGKSSGDGGGAQQFSPRKDEEEPASEKKSQGQKRKWIDVDKEVNSARRSLRSSIDGIHRQLEGARTELSKGIAEINALPLQLQKLCAGEMSVAKVRRQALELILANDERELASFLASFDKDAKHQPAPPASAKGSAESTAAASSAHGTACAMTKAPPCQNYKDLVVLSSLEDAVTSLDSCSDVASIKDIQNMFYMKKTFFANLLTACKSATAELRSALKSSTGPHGPGKDIGGKKFTPLGNIFEIGPQVGVEIKTYAHADGVEHDLKNVDRSTPFIMQCDPDKSKKFLETQCVKEHLEEFGKAFRMSEKHIRKNQGGRTQCKCPGPVRDSSLQVVKEAVAQAGFVFEGAGLKSDGKAAVEEALTSHTFGIASSCDSSGTERNFSPCLRFTADGSRKIVMATVPDLTAFMISEGHKAESAFNVQNMKDFFANMTLEQGTKYAQLNYQAGCQRKA